MDVDLLIVGGGINGAGIARDAAGRGLKVLLCEQDDLAAHTSSSSTKLIHGGLRYIEQYEFALVRKALQERERLIEAAPHIIWPLRFVLPHDAHLRPVWVIRAGLFLYDHLARRRRLPSSKAVNLRTHPAGAALDPHFSRGFEYSDAWVDDARLVVLNAMDAAARGATILTRTRFAAAVPDGPRWRATLVSNGATREIRAMLIVNAAGPWVDKVEGLALGSESAKGVRLVKGSHIIVRRLFTHQYAYIFQNPDGRIIFAIPYEGDFTLIGTTDVEFAGDPAAVAIDDGEMRYLRDMANRYFRADIQARDIVRSYAGVRPLLDDESADPATITRDYSLEWLQSLAPMLSVYGGKITTYRRLAEEAVDRIIERFDRTASGRRAAADSRSRPERKPWTAQAPLPGGDMPDADFERFLQSALVSYPWLPAPLLQRYARAYGTRIRALLGSATGLGDLGSEVLPGLYAREIQYLREHEWARTAEDVLWRRSKLGLHLPGTALQTLDRWLSDLSHA